MFFKESHIKELFTTGKEAASKWNGMDPFKRENVLFQLLSKGKVQAYEMTEFRERHEFKELPRHIRSALTKHWKDSQP